jgi:type II secretory pathway component PulF
VIRFIKRWYVRNALLENREVIFENLTDEVARDSAKRTDTISGVFSAWAARDSARRLAIAHAYSSIARRMNEGGSSFADAIGPMIPFEEHMVIWAGEQNGQIELALKQATRIKQLLEKMKDSVRAAILQPIAQFLGVLLTSLLMGTLMWPDMLRDLKDEFWPTWAKPAIYFDLWVARNWPALGIVLILLVLYHYTLPRWTGRSRQLFDRLPPWSTYRNESANVVLTSLASFLSNGFLIKSALEQIRDKATPYLRWHLNRIIPRIDVKGADAIGALNTGLFSQAVLDRLEDASRTRDLDNTIIHVGDKSLESLIKLVTIRAQVVSTIGTVIIYTFFVYSASVQLIGTTQATQAYIKKLQGHSQHVR